MNSAITWPLGYNVIRRRSVRNTFGMVRVRADGTPRPHQGWDFEAVVGTVAYALADGNIEYVRDQGDYGLQLAMAFKLNGRQLWAFYAHLDKVFVKEREVVTRNQLICTTGESGNAAGMDVEDQHLHFEIRTAARPRLGLSDRISPIEVFGKCPLIVGIAG